MSIVWEALLICLDCEMTIPCPSSKLGCEDSCFSKEPSISVGKVVFAVCTVDILSASKISVIAMLNCCVDKRPI